MRISVLKDDPGYDSKAAGNYSVMFNGKLVEDCVTADSNEGWIITCAKDNDGNIILKGDCIQYTERMYGKVSILPA